MYYLTFNSDINFDGKKVDFRPWKDLLKIYLEKGNFFEIRTWRDHENKKVNFLKEEYGIYCEEENMETVYSGMIDRDFQKDFLEDCFDEEGYPIYFTVHIFNDGELIFSSEHYGMECFIFGFDRHSVVEACDQLEEEYGLRDIAIYTDEDLNGEVSEETCNHDHNHCHCHHEVRDYNFENVELSEIRDQLKEVFDSDEFQ